MIVNTHAIDPQQLIEFFGSLSAERALDCLKVWGVACHVCAVCVCVGLRAVSAGTRISQPPLSPHCIIM